MDLAEAGLARATIEALRAAAGVERGRSAWAAGIRPPAPAGVDRDTADLLALEERLTERTRELSVAQREAGRTTRARDRHGGLGSGDTLDQFTRRLNRLEDVHEEVRYEVQAAGKRADAGSLRACRELIRSRVPRRARVHVIAKGDPVWLDLYGRPTATFPQDEDGLLPRFAFSEGVGAIAHLEAQRHRGADSS